MRGRICFLCNCDERKRFAPAVVLVSCTPWCLAHSAPLVDLWLFGLQHPPPFRDELFLPIYLENSHVGNEIEFSLAGEQGKNRFSTTGGSNIKSAQEGGNALRIVWFFSTEEGKLCSWNNFYAVFPRVREHRQYISLSPLFSEFPQSLHSLPL